MKEKEGIFMENKVYYGEYTLKHWIDLILRKNIILPEYQRYFVWKETDTKTLIETFNNKGFVPSIIIGSIEINNENKNIILDGQQRLTSIFLAYLGLFPDRETFKSKIKEENYADENDDIVENEFYDDVIHWRFDDLLSKGQTKEEIIEATISKFEYKKIDLKLAENFFSNTYLGFSYIVPKLENRNDKDKEQQKFYSTVFRHINSQGHSLLPQESREALYYLDKNLKDYFNPDFCKNITTSSGKIDFTRYLAFLSQYHEDFNKNFNKIGYGYAKFIESYYENYINKFVENPIRGQISQIPYVNGEIENLGLKNRRYESIIDLDIYFFGLLYNVVFLGKKIMPEKRAELKERLKEKIDSYKVENKEETNYHKKNPNALKYLRKRMEDSIKIYKEFCI